MPAKAKQPPALRKPTSGQQKRKPAVAATPGTRRVAAPPLARTSEVTHAYNAYPKELRIGLLALRKLVYTAADQTPAIGKLTETLRWGVPSYLTQSTKSGTTVRLGVESKTADRYGLYVPCQTTLIADFRRLYGELFHYSGKRALLFAPNTPLPQAELLHCLTLAFTYHHRKRLG